MALVGPPAYLGYRLGAATARVLPESLVPGLEKLVGRAAAKIMVDRRLQVERNVARVYGDGLEPAVVDGIVQETFTSYVRYWIESFRLPGTSAERIDEGVTISGFEGVTDALSHGNGVIVALPHLGGWEWAAFWLATIQKVGVTAVVEAIEPPELAEWFIDLRSSLGMELVPLDARAATACVAALRANRVLCLLCDRDISGDGVEVPFFGETTTLPAGPASLALRSGAPLLTAATYFDGRRHRFVVDPPLDTTRSGGFRADVRRVTTELAERLETLIRVAPEQWHLMQPNWPSDLTGAATVPPRSVDVRDLPRSPG